MSNEVLKKISYGLFLLCARGERDGACIINTAVQVASSPTLISISVNKGSFTADLIKQTGRFTVSVLKDTVKYDFFENFGLKSARDYDKFEKFPLSRESQTGIYYDKDNSCGYMLCNVVSETDAGSHTVFIASMEKGDAFSGEPLTYAEYFRSVKPESPKAEGGGYVCTVCGYVYKEDVLPDDFICPLCKHPASDFKKL